MKFLLIMFLAQTAVHAGILSFGFFKPLSRPELLLKDPWGNQLVDHEIERRLSETDLLRLHNIHQRKMAKAGLTDAPEIVEGIASCGVASSANGEISALTQAVFELPSVVVDNKPSFLVAPAGGDGGGPGGGSVLGSPVVSRSINSFVPVTQYRGRNLKQIKKTIDERFKKSSSATSLTEPFNELIFLANRDLLAQEAFVEYCNQAPSLMKEIAEEQSFLDQAIEIGSLEMVRALVRIDCNIHQPARIDGSLPIQRAILWCHYGIFEYLISLPEINPNAVSHAAAKPKSVLQTAFDRNIPIYAYSILSHPKFDIRLGHHESANPEISNYLQVLRDLNQFQSLNETDKAGTYYSLLQLGQAQGVRKVLEQEQVLRQATFVAPLESGPISSLAAEILRDRYVLAVEQESSFIAQRIIDTLKVVLEFYPESANTVFLNATLNNELVEFVKTLISYGHVQESNFSALTGLSPAMTDAIERARCQKYPEYVAAKFCVAESILSVHEMTQRNELEKEHRERVLLGFSSSAFDALNPIVAAEAEEWKALSRQYFVFNQETRRTLEELDRTQRIEAANRRNQEDRRLKAEKKVNELERVLGAQNPQREEILFQEHSLWDGIFQNHQQETELLLSRLERRVQLQRAERETRVNCLSEALFQDHRSAQDFVWNEFMQIYETLGQLMKKGSLLAGALASGEQTVEELLFDEAGSVRDWATSILTNSDGVRAIETLISNKKPGILRYILVFFERLSLDPRGLLAFAINQFGEKPKKGSDEARIVKLLQEASTGFTELPAKNELVFLPAASTSSSQGMTIQNSPVTSAPPEPVFVEAGLNLPLTQAVVLYTSLEEAIRYDHVPSVENFILNVPQALSIVIVNDPYGTKKELTPLFYAVRWASLHVLIKLKNLSVEKGLSLPAQELLNYAKWKYAESPNGVRAEIMRFLESWAKYPGGR